MDLRHIIVEGDSFFAIRWASGFSKAPQKYTVVVEEVIDLARHLEVSFIHVKMTANKLAKEEIWRCFLALAYFGSSSIGGFIFSFSACFWLNSFSVFVSVYCLGILIKLLVTIQKGGKGVSFGQNNDDM